MHTVAARGVKEKAEELVPGGLGKHIVKLINLSCPVHCSRKVPAGQ